MNQTKTKIVATVGPKSLDLKTLKLLIQAGTNVFRINASHGGHGQHQQILTTVRQAASQLSTKVGILYDLQGPKIRIGDLGKEVVEIKKNETIYLHDGSAYIKKQNKHYFPLTYKDLPKDAKPGHPLLLKDGLIELEVTEINLRKTQITCKVITGGKIGTKTSLNAPETKLSISAITPNDIIDLDFIKDKDIDFLALSFVRKASDIKELRKLCKDRNITADLIAKIERPEALKNIANICKESDAIMIARGDLGIEIPAARVPLAQQTIIKTALAYHAPVITATQVLSSMVEYPRPTRAEVSDAALAVMEGTDAIMLSNETTIGKYPVESVATLKNIIQTIEADKPDYCNVASQIDPSSKHATASNLTQAAYAITQKTKSKQLICITLDETKSSLLTQIQRLTKNSDAPIITIYSNNPNLENKINLIWGLHSCQILPDLNEDNAVKNTLIAFRKQNPKLVKQQAIVLLLNQDKSSIHLVTV